MLRIGEFSKLAKISIQTLRYYDQAGLLIPQHTNPNNNYRYYDLEQLAIARRINSLRQLGFSAPQIKDYLHADMPDIYEALSQKLHETKQLIEAEQERLRELEHWVQSIEDQAEYPPFELVQYETPDEPILSMPLTEEIENDGAVAPYIGEIVGLLGGIGIRPDKVMGEAHYLSCVEPVQAYPTPPQNMFEVLLALKTVEIAYLPTYNNKSFQQRHPKSKTRTVSIFLEGDYEQLSKANRYFCQWAQRNGYWLVDGVKHNYIRYVDTPDNPENLSEAIYTVVRG